MTASLGTGLRGAGSEGAGKSPTPSPGRSACKSRPFRKGRQCAPELNGLCSAASGSPPGLNVPSDQEAARTRPGEVPNPTRADRPRTEREIRSRSEHLCQRATHTECVNPHKPPPPSLAKDATREHPCGRNSIEPCKVRPVAYMGPPVDDGRNGTGQGAGVLDEGPRQREAPTMTGRGSLESKRLEPFLLVS